jgi:hypothetical protein
MAKLLSFAAYVKQRTLPNLLETRGQQIVRTLWDIGCLCVISHKYPDALVSRLLIGKSAVQTVHALRWTCCEREGDKEG